MREVFIILGYGIPKDSLKDGNMNRYLPTAFNAIHRAVTDRIVSPIVVLSGGATDMVRPYRRTEAVEMLRFMGNHIKTRYPKGAARSWKFLTEKRSISTLENLLFVQDLLQEQKILSVPKTIFFEWTRHDRIRSLAWRLFGPNVTYVPIDFDVSVNRYLDPVQIRRKEKRALHADLRAMQDPAVLRRHHEVYARRLTWLREAGPRNHAEAVKRWSEEEFPKIVQ